jgi:hypothetical protein
MTKLPRAWSLERTYRLVYIHRSRKHESRRRCADEPSGSNVAGAPEEGWALPCNIGTRLPEAVRISVEGSTVKRGQGATDLGAEAPAAQGYRHTDGVVVPVEGSPSVNGTGQYHLCVQVSVFVVRGGIVP